MSDIHGNAQWWLQAHLHNLQPFLVGSDSTPADLVTVSNYKDFCQVYTYHSIYLRYIYDETVLLYRELK